MGVTGGCSAEELGSSSAATPPVMIARWTLSLACVKPENGSRDLIPRIWIPDLFGSGHITKSKHELGKKGTLICCIVVVVVICDIIVYLN